MADFLRDCNSGQLKIDAKTFQETWCTRCHRPECDLAEYAKQDPMAVRNATWRERFFGMPQADITLPKYAQIAQAPFQDLLAKAMRLEISERRGDWSVPEIPILDGRIEVSPADTVDTAVQRLTHKVFLDDPTPEPEEPEGDDDDPLEDDDEEEEDLPEEPAPPPSVVPRAPPPPMPKTRNTPDPGEIIIRGGAQPTQRTSPAVERDPWAPPTKPTVTVVKTGAKIQFGADGKGKVVDG